MIKQNIIEFEGHYNDFAEHNSKNKKIDEEMLQDAIKNNKICARIYKISEGFIIKLYSSNGIIPLCNIVPILTNLGFKTITEDTFKAGQYFIHRYLVNTEDGIVCDISDPDVSKFIIDVIFAVLDNKIGDIALNRIAYLGKINIRYSQLITAYIAYTKQIKFSIDYASIMALLQTNYLFTIALVDLFIAKFSNATINKKEVDKAHDNIIKMLSENKNIALEKVITMMINLINATVRTNFYLNKNFISLKIKSDQLDLGAKPVPFAEIFVFSDDFEAIHIRNGAVSRGGLRWSDRGDDYRTEVFSLAKTQLAKNSIIVPSGSKGGFYVKKSGADKAFAVECYKNFLRGMLDITDNIVNGKIVQPKIAIYDNEDAYLVVAADKGTATFSDYANEISAEYKFWIQDGFASGGKNGYDHKKLAITANGTWESIKRHLLELDINIKNDTITAVGIGGMMGDVFGNGLIYSKNIKLIAVFNEKHIFIDPNPDTDVSYKERKRMFVALDGWDKYNAKLISKGGAVYSKNDTHIKLSKEAIEVLGITNESHQKSLSGDELIRYILQADVDLLFNGGIGTFIKAESESNSDVNDKTNDAIRLNGSEIGAKVIGEGGNLGMTQLGRIEYSMNGGKCNTDAIDNSAGVSCSDHEVNIKIALNKAVSDKKITLEERNKTLELMQDDVSYMVLTDNKLQTRIISISEQLDKGSSVLKYINLIKTLEESSLIKRRNESLPSDQEIINRSVSGCGLFKPELSVLLSYSKIYIKDLLLPTKIAEHKYFFDYLIKYFPPLMSAKFGNYIENHQLKNNIIITGIANEFVNLLGPSAFVDVQNITSCSAEKILIAYMAVKKIFDLDVIIDEIDNLDSSVPLYAQYSASYLLADIIKKSIYNVLSVFGSDIENQKILDKFIEIANDLHSNGIGQNKLFSAQSEEIYINDHLTKNLSKKLIIISKLRGIINIASIIVKTKSDIKNVSEIYNSVDKVMGLQSIKSTMSISKIGNYWDCVAIIKSLQSLSVLHSDIVAFLVIKKQNIKYFNKKCEISLTKYDSVIKKLKNASILAMSSLVIECMIDVKKELEIK